MPPDIHIVAGGTGAGKTTYARNLAARVGGARFSIDEWMTTLFWMDSPQPIEFAWTMDRIARCESQIREQVAMLARLGVVSVLDLGFSKSAHRAAFAQHARAVGGRPVLHWIDLPPEMRWARVAGRNAERGETWRMDVDREMFDFMEGEWQAPDVAEVVALDGVIVQ